MRHLPLEDVTDCVLPAFIEEEIFQSRLQVSRQNFVHAVPIGCLMATTLIQFFIVIFFSAFLLHILGFKFSCSISAAQLQQFRSMARPGIGCF